MNIPSIFANVPHINDIDPSKITQRSLLKDDEYYYLDDADYYGENELLYENKQLFCKVTLDLDNDGRVQLKNIPDSFLKHSITEDDGIKEYKHLILQSLEFVIYDKNELPFPLVCEFAATLLKSSAHEAIVTLVDIDVEDHIFRWDIVSVQFTEILSPQSREFLHMRDKFNEIERILDIPNNLGSIQGWLEIVKDSLKKDMLP